MPKMEILKHREAVWLVGEEKSARAERMRKPRPVTPDECYPESYPDRVISIRSWRDVMLGKLPSLSHMADRDHIFTVMNVTPAEEQGIRTHGAKVTDLGVVNVTFEDRWGKVAQTLRNQFGEDAELLEARGEDPYDYDGRQFNAVASIAKDLLAPTITHTGTGLYSVYETPTSVADTLNGDAVGQVITLTNGGLGTADAFKGGYVQATGTAQENLDDLPTFFSNTSGEYTLSAGYNNSFAYRAADNNFGTNWLDASTSSYWQVQIGTSRRYWKVRIGSSSFGNRPPASFDIQGSNNGSDWDVLLTVSGATWTGLEWKEWELTSQGDYTYYRLTNYPATNVQIAEIEFFKIGTFVENRSIVSHIDNQVTLEGDLTNWTDTTTVTTYNGWSSVQTAYNQLFSDQGSSIYSTSQYIRVFAGTFNENLTPNTALNPDVGKPTILEGDPNDSRDNIIIAPSSGPYVIQQADLSVIRHLTLGGTPTSYGFQSGNTSGVNCLIEDCVINATAASASVWLPYSGSQTRLKDCQIDGVGLYGIQQTDSRGRVQVESCTINGDGAGTAIASISASITGTVIDSWDTAIYLTVHFGKIHDVYNGTIYNCTNGIRLTQSISTAKVRLINNIVSETTNPLKTETSNGWPEETSAIFGPEFMLRNNCFHNYTNFFYDGVTGKTFAEFIAFNRVDASGDLDATDPLFADAPSGNFSLSTGSPCINAGHGSGVPYDANGNPYDKFNPDIGASSSGVVDRTVATPSITATDLADQDRVQVDIVAGNAADVSTIYYQTTPDGALQTWPNTVTGTGSEILTGLLVAPYAIWAVATRNGYNSLPSNIEYLTLAAADYYTTLQTVLYDWVKGVVGNPTVIWREANAPQQVRPYVSIKMNPTQAIGHDYHSGADVNGIETVEGVREFIFAVRVHGLPSHVDRASSISILERIRSSLEKRSTQATLCTSGLSFVSVEGFGDLAGIGGTEWEAQAFMDIRFRTTYSDSDDVGYIGTVTNPVGTLE